MMEVLIVKQKNLANLKSAHIRLPREVEICIVNC